MVGLISPLMAFERYVNSKDNQTVELLFIQADVFERYVNSKDNQTPAVHASPRTMFERYVNSKDNQTKRHLCRH